MWIFDSWNLHMWILWQISIANICWAFECEVYDYANVNFMIALNSINRAGHWAFWLLILWELAIGNVNFMQAGHCKNWSILWQLSVNNTRLTFSRALLSLWMYCKLDTLFGSNFTRVLQEKTCFRVSNWMCIKAKSI